MNRRGFTLIELIVALVLMGIVGGAIYQLLINNQRIYRQQTERVDLNSNLRAAVAILPTELRELNSNDPLGSDILGMGRDSIVYKAMRSLYTVCQNAVQATSTSGAVTLSATWFGIRPLDTSRDAVMLYYEGNPSTSVDNRWVHADVTGTPTIGTLCPTAMGPSSMTLNLTNVNPPNALLGVSEGAPFRGFERVKLKRYQDARGDSWVGLQRYSYGSSSWGSLEPVLGPVASDGLQFAYFDSTGTVTADSSLVSRIQITVIGRTPGIVQKKGGAGHLYDTLVTEVALRNNSRRN